MNHRAKYFSLKSSVGITLHDGDSRKVLPTPLNVDRRRLLADASTIGLNDPAENPLLVGIAAEIRGVRSDTRSIPIPVEEVAGEGLLDLDKPIFEKRCDFEVEPLEAWLKFNRFSTKNYSPQIVAHDALINHSQPIFLCEIANDDGRVLAGGKALNSRAALRSAVAEAVERTLASSPADKVFCSSAAELRENYGLSIPLLEAGPRDAYSDKLNIDWVRGYTATGQVAAIPAERVYYDYTPRHGVAGFEWQVTSGLAAGTSVTDAFFAALREVMERDAYWIAMSCRLRCPVIDPDVALARNEPLLSAIRESNLRIVLRDISLDWPLKLVHAVCVDASGHIPAFAHGAGSAQTVADAALAATLEALQLHAGLVRRSETALDEVIFGGALRSPDVVWSDPTARAELSHLLTDEVDSFAVPIDLSTEASLSAIVERVEAVVGRIFWCDLGRLHGLNVVRVFVENAILPYPAPEYVAKRLRFWLDRAGLRYPYSIPILT